MSVELQLTDAMWSQIQSVLTTVKPKRGQLPNQDDRMFIEAVLYVAKNGISWSALPEEFGNWSAVYSRMRRWKDNGTWEQMCQQLEQIQLLATADLSSFLTLLYDRTPHGIRAYDGTILSPERYEEIFRKPMDDDLKQRYKKYVEQRPPADDR